MQRKSVKARLVKSIGWENGILEVEYLSGLIHQYHDVTEAEYIRACVGAIDKKVRHIGKSHRFTKVSDWRIFHTWTRAIGPGPNPFFSPKYAIMNR